MSKPVVVSIPHNLGKEEAIRRLKTGIGQARVSLGSLATFTDENWTENRGEIRLALLGQTAHGIIEVEADHVRLEVTLPWILAMVAEKAKAIIRKEGQLLLEKK